MRGYVKIAKIIQLICQIILKVWAYSGLVLIFGFLLYYYYGGIFAFILLLFSVLGLLYQIQDNFLFYPELPSHSRVFIPTPSAFHLPYEAVQIRSIDGTLIHLYFIYQPKEKRATVPTMIYFHGNAGNMGHRLQNCVDLYKVLNYNILLVEYRGYGLSEGSPSEDGLYLDAKASLDYLFSRNDINHSEIIVFGRSLGGAVAIDLAIQEEYSNRIFGLIVENTFTSIPDMAKVLLGWKLFNYLPLFCYKNKFLSCNKVKLLRVPTLFISGMADKLVPPKMMAELHNRCGSVRKQILEIPLGTHNDTWYLDGYYQNVDLFIQETREQRKKGKISMVNTESKLSKNNIWSNVQNI